MKACIFNTLVHQSGASVSTLSISGVGRREKTEHTGKKFITVVTVFFLFLHDFIAGSEKN